MWLAWSEADFLPLFFLFFFFQYSDAIRDGNRTTTIPETSMGGHSTVDPALGSECPRLKCSRGHDQGINDDTRESRGCPWRRTANTERAPHSWLSCIFLWIFLKDVFTRGQFWHSGIVIACVCVCVCVSVCVSLCVNHLLTVRKQFLSITLLSTQDGGRHSGQGCLQRLFLTSMHVSKGYPCPPGSLQYVGFTGAIRWSVGLFSGRNRAA